MADVTDEYKETSEGHEQTVIHLTQATPVAQGHYACCQQQGPQLIEPMQHSTNVQQQQSQKEQQYSLGRLLQLRQLQLQHAVLAME